MLPELRTTHAVDTLHVLVGSRVVRWQRRKVGIGWVKKAASRIWLDVDPRNTPPGILGLLVQDGINLRVRRLAKTAASGSVSKQRNYR
jgi:hypothetical protein